MGFNSLGDVGLQHLATCLSANKTLKRLDVRYNGGGPRCAAVFASHLRENTSLTELVLDGNPLGAEGLRAFSRAAGEITSSLKLRDCLYDVKKPLTAVGLFMEEVKIGKGKKAITIPAKRMDAEPSRSLALAKARGSWGKELPDLQHHEAYDADTLQKVSDAEKAVEAETPLNMKEVLFDPQTPRGFYQLELDDPYERSVAEDILELCGKRPGLSLTDVFMADGMEEERKPEHFKNEVDIEGGTSTKGIFQ